jgi:hypothetical protein
MESQDGAQRVFFVRLILGLGQGLALYLLYSAFDGKAWPATVPALFAPLAVVALLIPFLVSQALGNLRSTTLIIWTVAASLIVAGLAWYDVWHAWPGQSPDSFTPPISPKLLLTCAVFLFVAHAVVSCGDTDRRIVARYSTLFDLAWKLGVQIAIITCFTTAFWIMLKLGIALFDMIKLTGFGAFIGHPWVSIPLTTVAAAAAIHITDTRANLVRGVRTLALTLLGWLLPVITAIAFAFLVSLVFTGLQPLWETRRATFLLMAAAVVLIIHINAAYQDGDAERRPPHILRVAGTLAAVLLIFIVWIAGYALWLRVAQYGWTVDRITTAAGVAVGGMFAVGYLVAALLPGLWLKLIERWNVYGTFFFLIVLFALSTPIADPMRLAVDSQVARLQSGAVKPDKFDFWYLRNHGGRFGHAALEALSSSKDKTIREGALAPITNGPIPLERIHPDLAHAVTVHPSGRVLPQSFLSQKWDGPTPGVINSCLFEVGTCDAVLTDLNGDGQDEIILIYTNSDQGSTWWTASVYQEVGGKWSYAANISDPGCKGFREGLLAGSFKLVAPPPPWPDLEVNGNRAPIMGGPMVTPAPPCK